ncbi:hypothetical protein C7B80_21870, partial [Cyanosarcina cf. burmensis CCALA 770]
MNDGKTNLYCRTDDSKQQTHYLRSIVGVVGFLGVTTSLILAIRPAQAGIIESVTEQTETRNKGCSGIEPSRDIKRAGQTALKHWVNRCGERAEIEKNKTKIGGTYWYGWSVFIPENWQDNDEGWDILNQFAAYPTKKGRKHPCGGVGSKISRRGNAVIFDLQRNGGSVDAKCTHFPIAKVAELRGKWTDIVMNVKWTGNNDGFLKLWLKAGNGSYVQKINYQGPTFWNDEGNGPYFKMGLYKGDPNFDGPPNRVVYTDEYRLGDANSSFEQVAPEGSQDTTTPESDSQDTTTPESDSQDTTT